MKNIYMNIGLFIKNNFMYGCQNTVYGNPHVSLFIYYLFIYVTLCIYLLAC